MFAILAAGQSNAPWRQKHVHYWKVFKNNKIQNMHHVVWIAETLA
jgi:hypothetical protein